MTNPNGRFGIHGGQYIPETLMNAVIELEEAYNHYKNDPEFNRELAELFSEYAGRPSRLYFAEKMTKGLGGAKIYLKREDPNHTGAHKINKAFENGKAFIAFITCGDPDLETTASAIHTAVENGTDLIELGIPFSDPTAEGPVIQGANIRALKTFAYRPKKG